MDAREAALLTLNTCERQGGWSDGALKKQLAAAGLDGRDAALATQLCFGVLQNKLLLDFYLGKFSNIPLKRMEGKVVQALRLIRCCSSPGSPTVRRWTARWPSPGPTAKIPGPRGW